MSQYTHEHADRAPGTYRTNQDAAAALRISTKSVAKLCREIGIETPAPQAQSEEAQQRRRAGVSRQASGCQ